MEFLHHASFTIGVLGTLVIMFGVLRGLLLFLRAEARSLRGGEFEPDRRLLRQSLGYYLLLGLEFFIAADIIETLMKPDLNDLLALGVIVVIRTVISCSLNVELKHEGATGRPSHV